MSTKYAPPLGSYNPPLYWREIKTNDSPLPKPTQNKLVRYRDRILDAIAPKNPVHHRREIHLIPFPIEVAIGKLVFAGLINSNGGHYNKKNYEELINKVGQRIAKVSDRPDLPYQFAVTNSNRLNAVCVPGAKIVCFKGIIERIEKEKDTFGVGNFSLEAKVASVLSHEYVHGAAQHSSRAIELGVILATVSKVLQIAVHFFLSAKLNQANVGRADESSDILLVGFDLVFAKINAFIAHLFTLHASRNKEFEADKYGMVYLKRAGYDPKVAIWLQKFFVKEQPKTDYTLVDKFMEMMSSHPLSEERVKENEKTLQAINEGLLA